MTTSALWPTRLDPTDNAVHAAVEIAAPPERVFEALTDPRELAAWWQMPNGTRTHEWSLDAREGARWQAQTVDAHGREATIEGEVTTVDAPRLLEYTWRAPGDDHETTVRYELAPAIVRGRSGTRLTVRHMGFGAQAIAASARITALGHVVARVTMACARPIVCRVTA